MSDIDNEYTAAYSEAGYWQKLKGYASAAGREVVERSLQLYYAAQAEQTPTWAKTVIYGALGYFISIIDAVPDITPFVGYTDDLGVLVAALAAVAANVTPDVKQQARDKTSRWLGEPASDEARQAEEESIKEKSVKEK